MITVLEFPEEWPLFDECIQTQNSLKQWTQLTFRLDGKIVAEMTILKP